LCGEERELRLSHLLPKFIFRWMQNTGGQYLRQVTNPNLRRQDGPKKYLLCEECEQRFSTREDYFSRNVFYPYIDRRQTTFDYDERLIYFLVSVLWRVLADKLDWYEQQNFNFSKELRKAERVWREYLLGEVLVQTTETERTNVSPCLTSCGEHCFPHVRYSRPSSNYYSGRIELAFSDLLR